MEVDEDININTNNNTNKVISSRVYEWPSSSSSRIVRVSRGSGGKDRHSKVLTSKGLRDRRVRLSVTTAIQFYDLQDRLGYDQPSKAVEWLIKAAANSIAELPSLDPSSFVNFNNNVADSAIINNTVSNTVVDNNNNDNNNNNYDLLLSRSNSSSASENSKSGSGLSLSRSENRIRARERARGLAAAKKENEKTCSFTDLLSGGGIRNVTSNSTPPMDYFQQFENNNNCGQQHHEQQHFSFLQENNVTSSGYNNIRGTLQSNLMSNNNLHNLQRFHQPMVDNGGSSSPNFPFFVGPTMGGTSQFVVDGLDDSQRLRLYGGDDGGHYYDNHKDKSKS